MFRGVRIDNGEVIEGWLVKGRYTYIISYEQFWSAVVSPCCPNHMSTQCYVVHPQSIAQQTGREDKNGKMIYGSIEIDGELTRGGDVARFINGLGEPLDYKVALKDCKVIPFFSELYPSYYCEITGTQWENDDE